MAAVGGALVVGVVLVELDGVGAGDHGGALGGVDHDAFSGLVPDDGVAGGGALGCGVLGVGVVDVEAGAVGEDDVGEAEVLVGELGGVGDLAGEVEAAGVAEGVLLLEVPAGPAGARRRCREVGVDHLGGGHHRVGPWLPGHGDAVLGLDAHHPPNTHIVEPIGAAGVGRRDRAASGGVARRAGAAARPARAAASRPGGRRAVAVM